MELSKNYIPAEVETKWNQQWKSKGYFTSKPDDRKPFTVVIPPPNVTGVLHMGHTLNETVQDILVRKARMDGFNACWIPGSDHASIATEAKVVQMLKERGIDKKTLSREAFLKYAFEWKEKYGGIIYHQIEKLGCSVDWDRVTFTMDDHYYSAVIKVFVDLFEKGLIYRGARMINWDPAAKTALSDEEVEFKETIGKLFHVKYFIANEDGSPSNECIVVATGRPETIMGDTAVCLNPTDQRYTYLKGKKVIVPLVNRLVPIIYDEYVDASFGTGALKVTPAHDINDYNLGLKHGLPIIDTLNEDGTISEVAGLLVGLDRFVARKKIILLLQEADLFIKETEHPSRIGYSQRSGAVVEPRISTQWFVKMKELGEPALQEVLNGNINIHPGDKFLATYKHWLTNLKDWCISRQLWWGQQIPAWYDNDGNCYVAENWTALLEKHPHLIEIQATLKQDEDVLDTWFSSWLWPIEVFKGISNPNNEEINYYYPTSVLVTGQDIIFFWVARMVMAGMEYQKTKPFSDVYFTGMVRDNQGRKMSKSLGNSPDLLELIDKYGADAVRFGIMISSPAGNDLLFDESALEQGRNFNNKLWNALKLLKMWEERLETTTANTISNTPSSISFAESWFINRLNQVRKEVNSLMQQFRLSEALKIIYSLIWDDFCSWYLEWIKPGFEQPINPTTYNNTIHVFSELMQLLHPFMPFITEEIDSLLKERTEDICIRQASPIQETLQDVLQQGALLQQIITNIRDAKNKNRVKPKDIIQLSVQTNEPALFEPIASILCKQVNAEKLIFVDEPIANTIVVAVEKDKFFIGTEAELDTSHLKEDLLKDLQYQQQFLESVLKKLSNERFVQNAKPEVIALERKKQADAEARIQTIQESLASL